MRTVFGPMGLTGLCLALLLTPAQSQTQPSHTVHLHFARFDPAVAELSIPVPLRGDKQIKLWIVQLNDKPTEQARAA
ncbi:MAG: hypothetical protein ACYTFN_25285, partial [Planctomycetota bacterium]